MRNRLARSDSRLPGTGWAVPGPARSVILADEAPRKAVTGRWSIEPGGKLPAWWPGKLVREDWRRLDCIAPEQWPRTSTRLVRSGGVLVPKALADEQRQRWREPPPLPGSLRVV